MARHFNGTTDVIDVGVINLDPVQPQVMVSAWVKPDSVATDGHVVIGRWDNSGAEQYFLGVYAGGHIQFAIQNVTSNINVLTSTTAISAGVWSLIGATFGGQVMTTWINAVPTDTLNTGLDMKSVFVLHTLIGTKADGGSFAGSIAEVSVFDQVNSRTPTAFTALLQGASPVELEGLLQTAGHVGYWPLLGASPEPNPLSVSITGTTVVDHPPVRTGTAFRF